MDGDGGVVEGMVVVLEIIVVIIGIGEESVGGGK